MIISLESQSSPGEDGLQPMLAWTSTTLTSTRLNPLRARMGCNEKSLYRSRKVLRGSQSSPGEDGLQPGEYKQGHHTLHSSLNPLRARMGCNNTTNDIVAFDVDVSILSGRGWVATAGNANPVRSEGSEQENRNRWH